MTMPSLQAESLAPGQEYEVSQFLGFRFWADGERFPDGVHGFQPQRATAGYPVPSRSSAAAES
jgi:hypothetical protein